MSSKAGRKSSTSASNNLNSLLVTNVAGSEKVIDTADANVVPTYNASRGRKLSKQLDINVIYPEGESGAAVTATSQADGHRKLSNSSSAHINLVEADIPTASNVTKRAKSARKSTKPTPITPLEKPKPGNDIDLLITQKKIIVSPVSRDEVPAKAPQRQMTPTGKCFYYI